MFLRKQPLLDVLLEALASMGAFLAVGILGGIIWCIPIMLLWNFVITHIFFVWPMNAWQAIGLYVMAYILTKSHDVPSR